MSELCAEVDAAEAQLPASRLLGSENLQWTSVLARSYREDAHSEEFCTRPTGALLLVLITGGVYTIESRVGSTWQPAVYRAGSIGITAPGNASTLRWRSAAPNPMTSTHLYLDAGLFIDADTGFDGGNLQDLPDHLSFDDPTVRAMATALDAALENSSSPLYADSAAQFLAAHLVQRTRLDRGKGKVSGRLSATSLNDVVGYMHEHLAENVTLDDLSQVARLSKYHFLRSFTITTNVTPHQFLTDVRMQHAATLLRTTQQPIAVVGARCGFRSASHFATAFRKAMGASPVNYRGAQRD